MPELFDNHTDTRKQKWVNFIFKVWNVFIRPLVGSRASIFPFHPSIDTPYAFIFYLPKKLYNQQPIALSLPVQYISHT